MNQEKLLELLEQTIKYTPIVYNQISATKSAIEQGGASFTLEYKHTSLPEDGLLFYIPIISCIENASLTIRVPTLQSNGTYTYSNKVYQIQVENNDGAIRTTQPGDIIAYRMCIFRFKRNTNTIILCNSPLYNSAKFTSVEITNAKFLNKPILYNADDGVSYTLVNSKEFEELKERVSLLENKFLYGNVDAEEALADQRAGTIYIKVEG